jgi:hypothetical protein
MNFARVVLAAVWASIAMPALAEEAVSVGGALALLNKPAAPHAAIILIPGGDGRLSVRADGTFGGLQGNQLVRTRKAYLGHGIATLTLDLGVDAAAAVRYMRSISRKVVVVGTSRGTLRIPGALPAQPDGIVLTSGFLDDVRSAIGSSAALPRTLIVHHKRDGCRFTPPGAVAPFKAWGGAKVQVAWLDGGTAVGNPCRARGYHGFNGIDGSVVAVVAQFARR